LCSADDYKIAKEICSGTRTYVLCLARRLIHRWCTKRRDSSLNVYVLEASTGTIYKLAPSGSTYVQTTLYGPDAALQKTTGMSIDSAANFYIASGPDTGTSGDAPDAENATAGVYKFTLSSGSYTRTSLGSGWSSPSATAVDFAGNIWVSDYSANEISVLVPSGSGYTQTPYKSITNLRTLVTNKTGQLYGLGVGSPDAVIWTGGAEPHNGGTSPVGTPATPVPVTVVFDAPSDVSSYSVVTQGATGLDFTDAGGSTCSPQAYAAGLPAPSMWTLARKLRGWSQARWLSRALRAPFWARTTSTETAMRRWPASAPRSSPVLWERAMPVTERSVPAGIPVWRPAQHSKRWPSALDKAVGG
jgi:hypothetical protein